MLYDSIFLDILGEKITIGKKCLTILMISGLKLGVREGFDYKGTVRELIWG